MDEDISAISANTKNTKIINFFTNNKKKIISVLSIIILLIFSYFILGEIKTRNKINIADRYNSLKINFDSGKNKNLEKEMIQDYMETPLLQQKILPKFLRVFLQLAKKMMIAHPGNFLPIK